jgi:hypothetical protein
MQQYAIFDQATIRTIKLANNYLLISCFVLGGHLFVFCSVGAEFPSLTQFFGHITHTPVGKLGPHAASLFLAEEEEC